MKNKLKPVWLFLLALALVFALSACGAGTVDQDAINMDQPAQQTQEAQQTPSEQTPAAAESETAQEEEEASGGGLFSSSPAGANYDGPRTKVGKLFAGWFAQLLEWLYLFTHRVGLPSWILTIFLFTLIVRGLMQPLMFKQMRSSRKMQLLKPEIEEIRRRYASNPQKIVTNSSCRLRSLIYLVKKATNGRPC